MAFGISTSYVLENDERFQRSLENASEVLSDFRVPFGLITRDFYRSEKAIFQLKGPGQYPPFKNSISVSSLGKRGSVGLGARRRAFVDIQKSPYQKKKLRKFGFDYPLLKATGALEKSITTPSAPGSVNLITPLSLVIGSSISYGIYHQSDDPREKIPLRKFVFIGPEAIQFATSDQQGRLERWLNIINDAVVKALGKAKE